MSPVINQSGCNQGELSTNSLVTNKMSVNLRTTESRLQHLEHLMTFVGNYLTKTNWNLSNQQVEVIFKNLSKSQGNKNRKKTDKQNSNTYVLHHTAILEAINYWRNQFQLYTHLDSNTTSGRMMEMVYKGYFTEFDPHQVWLTPDYFFQTIIDNGNQTLLGPATATLVLRLTSLTNNEKVSELEYFYKQCSHLVQINLPNIYSNPNIENILALLFVSMTCMSFNDMMGFYKHFSSAARMAFLLDLENTKDMSNILPESHPSWFRYNRESQIWQVIYYLDAYLSVIYGLPRQLTKSNKWEENIEPKLAIKYLNLVPFYTVPVNPPRLINSFSTMTPALEEANILSFYIVNRVKLVQDRYSHITDLKNIPIQEIFFNPTDYQECVQLSKHIQYKLVNLYTLDLMKEYLQKTQDHENLYILMRHISHSLALIIEFHYPHLLIFPQPVVMPPSYIPRILKAVDQLMMISNDYLQLKNQYPNVEVPIKLYSLWQSLFTCLNISLQNPSNRVNQLIQKLVIQLSKDYRNCDCSYSVSNLQMYLERYGHSIDQYFSSDDEKCEK